ncbi:hexokinase-domain-containing protein [Radiomyces spectabilis]|uniref:hexokinase-domain-containing protein n=1 Tax=Radiomyces spectabilis TaxID=64574 RepID=UPI00221F92AC|nr:hexokinase-domain-containing protein [Radiomyces spectabilis]KAI8366051.1 hexokinase-domain-containing protein [Radiomyces spectabilis]
MESICTDAQKEALQQLECLFNLDSDQLRKFADHLVEELDDGLRKKDEDSAIAMLPSWITRHPTGQEKGQYVGLELSGSYVHLYLVELLGQGRTSTRQQKYLVADRLKKGSIHPLIEFIAGTIGKFLDFIDMKENAGGIPIGLAISFPLHQTSLQNAVVLKWTKDFDITDANDKDIVALLQTELQKRYIPITIKAVLNGTAASLLAHSYRSLDTLLSCTVSTGTNAAYWEKASAVKKCNFEDGQEVIINTEWGTFGRHHEHCLPRTFYDNRVDRESTNAGVHHFEKMVSGLYLGEIVRQILVDLVDRRILFAGRCSSELNQPQSLPVSYMNAMEQDESEDLTNVEHIMESIMNIPKTSRHDRHIVKRVCQLVSQRAARLVAAGMSAIIKKSGALETGLTVSVEGTIYEHYPSFPNRVNEALRELYDKKFENINIGVTPDGNGVGAALAAMIGSCESARN